MPSKNATKIYLPQSFYHAYNRGHNKQNIFIDDKDYKVFLNHFKRHLSDQVIRNNKGVPYKNLSKLIEVNAFCLMPNHFHILFYQTDYRGMERFMRSVMGSYSNYFNNRHGRVGALFQGRYKAVFIDSLDYSRKIREYIHKNPESIGADYKTYKYSTAAAYRGSWSADWVNTLRLE